MWPKIKLFFKVLFRAAKDFFGDSALKYSASLSYYTAFSIAPVLIIVIGTAGLFFGREAVTGEVYRQFSGLMGAHAAELVQNAIRSVEMNNQSLVATIVGGVTLLLGASGVFAELQDSLNRIWSVKATAQKGWLRYLSNRLISFSMVISLGFLLMVSLLLNTVLNLLNEHYISRLNLWAGVTQALNVVIIMALVTALFAFVFRFLPDVRLAWRDVWAGALFTAVLFLIGKLAIGYYLSTSDVGNAFGAAGSLAILLVWVYYSSAIVFFGAEFTKHYVLALGRKIASDDYATFVVKKEEELPDDAHLHQHKAVQQAVKAEEKAVEAQAIAEKQASPTPAAEPPAG